ncbi:MAG: PTS system mannose/fructose/sorbose family transporter subunit IID [Nitrospirota bacterium]|nr:PTS system mannose/fructose/sorbose family transporter subunit IID [Nitrospirota bacterium]
MSDAVGRDKSIVRKMFFRSFLLQGSWNFERMQNLGFANTIFPLLRALYRDDSQRREVMARHTAYFNTQPYLASFSLGATAQLEIEVAAGRARPEDVERLKTALMGPLGALGDSLFWGGVKPVAALIAVVLLLSGFVWAPLVFLALYNVPHLFARWVALRDGYDHGVKVIQVMAQYKIQRKVNHLKAISLALAGMIPAMAWSAGGVEPLFPEKVWPLVFLGVVVLFWLAARKGVPAAGIVAGVGLLAVIYSFLA